MKQLLASVAILAVLAGQTMAQSDDGSEAVDIVDGDTPSGEVTPDSGETPIPAPLDTVESPVLVNVQGVEFTLPEGWQAISDIPTDKLFISPDERYTLLAFWWFPDEPLAGFDDIIEVNQVVVDNEPMIRTFSEIGEILSLQNISKRARSDSTRFVFTVEGSKVSPEELQAVHDTVLASLRFGTGFDTPEDIPPVIADPLPPEEVTPTLPEPVWDSYENTRFGTSIAYPSNLFEPMAPPANNDGRTFGGIDGSHRFFVFGQNNIGNLAIPELIGRDIDWALYEHVDISESGDDWYILAGRKDGTSFFRKVLVDWTTGHLHEFEISYPTALAQDFEPIAQEMAASFAVPEYTAPPPVVDTGRRGLSGSN